MVYDWEYVSIDLQGDPHLPLAPGTQWTNAGKNYFLNFSSFWCFCFMWIEIWNLLFFADIRPEIPPRVYLIARRVAWQIEDSPYKEGVDLIVEVEHNLEALTKGIPEYASIDKVPLQYQRHTIRVSARLHGLLNRVIKDILCNHEQHVGG